MAAATTSPGLRGSVATDQLLPASGKPVAAKCRPLSLEIRTVPRVPGGPSPRPADRVEKASGGRLKVEALPGGAIVPAFEVVDATHKGVIDGAYTCTYYYIGKHRAAALFTDVPGGPFGLDTFDYMSWHYEGGGSSS